MKYGCSGVASRRKSTFHHHSAGHACASEYEPSGAVATVSVDHVVLGQRQAQLPQPLRAFRMRAARVDDEVGVERASRSVVPREHVHSGAVSLRLSGGAERSHLGALQKRHVAEGPGTARGQRPRSVAGSRRVATDRYDYVDSIRVATASRCPSRFPPAPLRDRASDARSPERSSRAPSRRTDGAGSAAWGRDRAWVRRGGRAAPAAAWNTRWSSRAQGQRRGARGSTSTRESGGDGFWHDGRSPDVSRAGCPTRWTTTTPARYSGSAGRSCPDRSAP